MLSFFIGEEKITGNPQFDPLLNALAGALLASGFAAYIVAIVICGMKGKQVFMAIGIVAIFMPAISFWPVIGAIRIAKPDSTWARKYYGEEKMRIALARFPQR